MYERFFGLADQPFRLTPDPRYLFLSRKHAEALAHLKLGLEESSGFVCITGDVGTGKTTLLRAFLGSLGPETATAYIFNPPLSPLELLKTVNGELGIPTTGASRKRLVDALNAHLLAQRELGRRAIVVIDEAQTLPMDVLEQLRLLSNLETTTEKLLRLVLVGQPQLRALLLHPELVQLNQRITLRWHMGPLSARETAAYIRHRLAVAAGAPPPRIFTRMAIRLVHRFSRGVPRLINMVAHRSMLAGFAADRRVVTARLVRQAYREIGVLPLAAAGSPYPNRTWAAVGVAAGIGVIALSVGLAWRPGIGVPGDAESSAPAATSVPDHGREPVTPPPAATADPTPAPTAEAPAPTAAADPPPEPPPDRVAAGATPPPGDPPPVAATPPVADPPAAAPPPAAEAPTAPPLDPTPPAADPPELPLAAATPPATEPAPHTADATPPATGVPPPAVAPSVVAPTSVVPASPPAQVALATPTPEPTPPAAGDIERRLASVEERTSAHAATDAVLAAWHVPPLAIGESGLPIELTPIAQRRGLEYLPIVGNASMLRLLDLPAIIELRVPDTHGVRYAALTGIASGRFMLVVGGEQTPVEAAFLDRHWFGEAHVLWRDFESLGRAFGREGRGPNVARLQALLRRAGTYRGQDTGVFDGGTEAAVLDFQRSRYLVADGRVGRLTRIVLYAAAGGYPRPTLGASS